MIFYRNFLLFFFFTSVLINGISSAENLSEKNLFEKTIIMDISTADYYELLAWCRHLGLPEKGTRKELQSRLYEYYNASGDTEDEKKKQNILIIESAERSEYFTIEKIDENYIIISGNVVLKMEDIDNDVKHIINTDKIIINQEQNLITAYGNVFYSRISQGGEEIFRGEKLSFDINIWEGVFIDGISEKMKTSNDKDIKFYYSGDRIYRSENDVIIIDNAEITSSNPEDPYYKFKADRIWVLSPGEWGVKNAVLYVGHIPVFYFPFFFNPGDKVVFNPAYGFKIPQGYFMQTTTYLQGKTKETGGFSFLALTEEEAEYETELNGIFLRKTEKIKKDPGDDFVKVMFDIYSRLGFFTGIEGLKEKSGIFDKTSFYAGLARSRNIYQDSAGFYTPFYEDEEGVFASTWNSGNFLSYSLPLRFGAEVKTGIDIDNFKSRLSFEIFSDPFFLRDFNDRAEKTDWSRVLGLESDEDTSSQTVSGLRDRLWWYVHNSYRSTDLFRNSFIKEINILKFDTTLNWNNKIQPAAGFRGLDNTLSGFIPFSARTDYFFPEQYFYYPEYYILPDISLTVMGDLYSKTYTSFGKKAEYRKTDEKPGSSIIPPWEKDTESFKFLTQTVERDIPVIPFIVIGDEKVKGYKSRDFFYHAVSYTFSPNFAVTSTLDHNQWLYPDEVTLDKSYSVLRTYGNLNLSYKAQYYEDLLSFNNNMILIGDFKSHYDRSDNITDEIWDSYKNQDYKSSFYRVENKSLFLSYPLYRYDMLDTSFIRYQLDTVLVKREFDYIDGITNTPVYKDSHIRFEKQYFTKNEADFNLRYLSWWNQIQLFRIRTVLPPLLQEIENENIIKTGPLTSTLILKAREISEERWEPDNIIWKEKLEYSKDTFIEEILEYDSSNDRWDKSETVGRLSFFEDELFFLQSYKYSFSEQNPLESITTLNLWYFSFIYKAEKRKPWEYNRTTLEWIENDYEEFIPSEFSAKIDHSKYFMPVWRNRIRYKSRISSVWNMDLQQVTENSLIINIGFDLKVHEFLDFTFNSSSENNRTYRYIPALADKMGEPWVNPYNDLMKSFNFFDNGKSRYESFFKLKSLDFKAVHHLSDWDLTVQYTGSPDINYPVSGIPEWKWRSELTVMMQWNPIPEIKSVINVVDDKYSF